MIIQKQINEPLLNRKDVICLLNHHEKTTPRKDDIKKELANDLKVAEELIVISKVQTKYGIGSSKIFARVYKTKKDLDNIEKINKKKKNVKQQQGQEQKTQ